ncbi:MAG: cyclic nucleotide-binding domain-containing protein [Mariprofundaceae bacterium]|nr:cyclic nucleotide-binding domain-containing protein [Mariprofundaceae bacterium]
MTENKAPSTDLASMLASSPLFETLPEAVRDNLLKKSETVTLAPGEMLIKEGEFNYHLYLLVRGSVRIETAGEAVATLGTGNVVGEISTTGLSTPVANVIAETVIEAVAFPIEEINETALEYPVFAEKMREIGMQRYT